MIHRHALAAIAAAIALVTTAAASPGEHEHPGRHASSHARDGDIGAERASSIVARTYPGRVVSARADFAGGEEPHYHVALVLPGERLVRFDVDAASGRIENHRWDTDAVLRRQMAELREAVAYASYAPMSRAEYAGLGQVIEARIGRMVEACNLAPEADQALHVLIGGMLESATALQREPERGAAWVRRTAGALDDYGRQFEHPGWMPLL